MELFHYHYWTPFVEETEMFYKAIGFSVVLRMGKKDGQFQTFNPPMQWEDFRGTGVLFRIIEMRKGRVNVTFGFGKRPAFDHIGILVSEEEYEEICTRAKNLGWTVEENDRRTFIHTPYQMKVELQLRHDVVGDGDARIMKMNVLLPTEEAIYNMKSVIGGLKEIEYVIGEKTNVQQVWIEDTECFDKKDGNGVTVTSESAISFQEMTDHIRPMIKEFMVLNWGDDLMVSQGHIHRLSELPGFVALTGDSIVGIVTYNKKNNRCEIVSLDSMQERKGIGTMLLQRVENKMKELGCAEMWLITSNDNTHAMQFYQKRGYHMYALHRGTIDEARKIKPTIPLVTEDGIPIESEIEFRKQL